MAIAATSMLEIRLLAMRATFGGSRVAVLIWIKRFSGGAAGARGGVALDAPDVISKRTALRAGALQGKMAGFSDLDAQPRPADALKSQNRSGRRLGFKPLRGLGRAA